MELKDILTRLMVEDICLNKQDCRALGLLINESEYADAPDSSEYFNMQGMRINVEFEGYKMHGGIYEDFSSIANDDGQRICLGTNPRKL
jgi:hypothetical protein